MVRSSILWDPYCLAHLSWEDIAALMLREKETPRCRVHALRGGLLNLASMSCQCFRRQFRFEKADFPVLVRALKMPQYITSAQEVRVTATEALCICLRRLAYPKRLCDLQEYFGRHYSVVSSVSNKVLYHIERNFGCLLNNINIHPWLKHSDFEAMSERGPICRPSQDQRLYFSVHKRLHVLKYQSSMCPNGLICQLDGPYPGRIHDAGILRDSQLYEKLEALALDKEFVIYGDPAYPLRPLLMKPYGGAALTAAQQEFNSSMSAVRQSVEWGFEKVISEFAFVDLKKSQKILLQAVPRMYRVAVILTNCHACMYGNQVSTYFDAQPPCLQDYLSPASR
ncbi:hypothetical protein MRX96_050654 [Rhipicephalus microplus]